MALSEFTEQQLAVYRDTWKDDTLTPEQALDTLGREEEVAISDLSDEDMLQLMVRHQSQMILSQVVQLEAVVKAANEVRGEFARLQLRLAQPNRAARRGK